MEEFFLDRAVNLDNFGCRRWSTFAFDMVPKIDKNESCFLCIQSFFDKKKDNTSNLIFWSLEPAQG